MIESFEPRCRYFSTELNSLTQQRKMCLIVRFSDVFKEQRKGAMGSNESMKQCKCRILVNMSFLIAILFWNYILQAQKAYINIRHGKEMRNFVYPSPLKFLPFSFECTLSLILVYNLLCTAEMLFIEQQIPLPPSQSAFTFTN